MRDRDRLLRRIEQLEAKNFELKRLRLVAKLSGWEAGKKAVLEWLRNEDIEHDPDDLYTGRAHRVAAVEKLKKP